MREEIMKEIVEFQRNEITEYEIYKRLAERVEGENAEILKSIARDEKRHYEIMKRRTKMEVKPSAFKIFWYILLSKIFGLTFALKAMEKGEKIAQESYEEVKREFPEIVGIIEDEEKHELKLIRMIDEERIDYISSMVLGLNDAIVELAGTLAGLTFALRNSKIVGLAGVITGISAALSMAVSEYLSQKSEIEGGRNPLKAAVYTGVAYMIVVTILVFPYFVFSNPFVSLSAAIVAVILVISLFTYFVSVVKETSYSKNFLEMLTLSMGVMIVSFIIGLIARKVLGVDID